MRPREKSSPPVCWRCERTPRISARPAAARHSAYGPSRGVIVWRRSGERLAALIAAPAYLDRVWFQGLRAIGADHNVHISLTGPDGHEWLHAGVAGDALRRTASDTGLPFTLRVASSDPTRDTATFTERRRLIAGMVAGLGLLVVAGGYVTARGLARELAAARLQSDFVAAVSHEFRTPVASVRQLSELLDEGRVPDESRRSEYYGLLRRESVRLQHLVENLLDFGRMESAAAEYRLAPVALDTMLHELTRDFADEVRISGRRIAVAIEELTPDRPRRPRGARPRRLEPARQRLEVLADCLHHHRRDRPYA